VATSPKVTGQVILETHQSDPLLAVWQYGLGRAVAWTSDATSRWATDWLRWEEFPTFWGQTVRWSIGDRPASNLEAQVEFDGEQAVLSVDARNPEGAFLDGLSLTANVIDPSAAAESLNLQQVAPGRYEAAFIPTVEGAYLIGIGSPEDGTLRQTTGWVLGYSPEYTNLADNPDLLANLVRQTGGRVIDINDVTAKSTIFEHNLEAAPRHSTGLALAGAGSHALAAAGCGGATPGFNPTRLGAFPLSDQRTIAPTPAGRFAGAIRGDVGVDASQRTGHGRPATTSDRQQIAFREP
jgi:hypothetical protein